MIRIGLTIFIIGMIIYSCVANKVEADLYTISSLIATGGIICIVIGIVMSIVRAIKGKSSSYSSSSEPSFDPVAWAENRRNGPHTCGNCKEYSSARGECKHSDNPMSANDSCGNWN